MLLSIGMSHRNPDEVHGVDGPDYVTLVIEWDALADNLERGTATASQPRMATKDPDWMIDQAGKESFPASDPPAWGSSHAAPSESTVEGLEDLEAVGTQTKRRYRTPILLGVLGLFALTGLVVGIRYARRR